MGRFAFGFAVLMVGSLVALGATAAVETSPQAKWKLELKDANDAWAHRRLAILKIDDAVYLKDGQAAYLTGNAGVGYKWSLTSPRGVTPSIKFANGKGLLRMLGQEGDLDLLTLKDGVFPLNEKADIKAQIAQVDPGVDGLRVILYNQNNTTPKTFAPT